MPTGEIGVCLVVRLENLVGTVSRMQSIMHMIGAEDTDVNIAIVLESVLSDQKIQDRALAGLERRVKGKKQKA